MTIDGELFFAQENPDPTQKRLGVTCKCGHAMDMPVTALGMVMACIECGEKISIDRGTASPQKRKTPGPEVYSTSKPYHIQRLAEKLLGELLVEEGVVSETQLAEALAIQKGQGGKIGEILIALGYVDMPAFVAFLARQPGVASIDPLEYVVSQDVASLVPVDFALEHEVFPIDKLGLLLTVAMACPLDIATIKKVEAMTGLRVKPLLCTTQQIRAVIKKYAPIDGYDWGQINDLIPEKLSSKSGRPRMKTPISTQIQEIDMLPLLPGTIHLVNEVLQDENSSATGLAAVIAMDPPMSAKVLSMANTGVHGFPGSVYSVDRAVSLMGMNEVSKSVLAAAGENLFSAWQYFNYQAFWTEALCCATATRLIAEVCNEKQTARAYTAGLLHDIGRIVLHHVVPGCYALLEKQSVNRDIVLLEENTIGVSHVNAGYVLAVSWGLPDAIAEAIRCHHTPQEATVAEDVVAMVAVGDALSQAREPNPEANQGLFEGCRESLACLGLHQADVVDLLHEYFSQLEHLFTDV